MYKVVSELESGKMPPSVARSITSACNSWLKANEGRKLAEMEQRIAFIEAEKDLEAAKLKARKRSG